MEKKTSEEWFKLVPEEFGLVIYDPDGWDRTNYYYSYYQEEITKEEFINRVMGSTCLIKTGFSNFKF